MAMVVRAGTKAKDLCVLFVGPTGNAISMCGREGDTPGQESGHLRTGLGSVLVQKVSRLFGTKNPGRSVPASVEGAGLVAVVDAKGEPLLRLPCAVPTSRTDLMIRTTHQGVRCPRHWRLAPSLPVS